MSGMIKGIYNFWGFLAEISGQYRCALYDPLIGGSIGKAFAISSTFWLHIFGTDFSLALLKTEPKERKNQKVIRKRVINFIDFLNNISINS